VFHTRCWKAKALGNPDVCREEIPPLDPKAPGHLVACHFPEVKKLI
jgi:peptide/nickel transport system ATP-binding protein/oligopeptide transport system ATP-binding protein